MRLLRFGRLASFARNDGLRNALLFGFIFLLPTQFGKHFFFDFSYLSGVRVDYLSPTLYVTDLLVLALLILNYKKVFSFFKNKVLLVFLFLLLLPVFISLSPPVSLYRYTKILELLVVFAVFSKVKINKKIFFYGFFLAALFEGALAVLQFVNKRTLQGVFYFFGERYIILSMPDIAKATLNGVEFLRPYATFSHPNSMAGFFLLLYSSFLFLNLKQNQFLKNLFLYIVAFIVFLSFSKVAIFAFLLINLFYLVFGWKRLDCKFCYTSRIFLFLVLAFVFASSRTDPFSLQKRLDLLENSVEILSKNLVLGVGLGNYLVAQNSLPKPAFPSQPVHNIFLLYFSEVGIFLGAATIFLLWQKLKKYLKKAVFFLPVLAFFLTGLFDHYWLTLQQNFLLLAVFAGVVTNPEFSVESPG